MRKKLVVVLVALGMLVLGVPGQANAYLNAGYVNVYVDGLKSQSNMLFSYQSNVSYEIGQEIVQEAACGGESGSKDYPCRHFSWGEPQNGWVNAGWCAGFRDEISTDFGTQYGEWRYHRGGYNGVSVSLNPSDRGEMPPGAKLRIRSYLVPVGVAGCTY